MGDGNAQDGVSVVIPTLDRAAVVLDTVGDLLQQEGVDWELIIIDQSREVNKALLAMCRAASVRARYFKANFRGLPQARNAGWRAAAKDIVLYVDDDIRCGRHFVKAHLSAHRRTGASLIAGRITELRGDRPTRGSVGSFNRWTGTSTRNFHTTQPRPCLQAPGGNFSVRRDVLRAVGGFDEHLSVGAALYEETEFALRVRAAGYSAWFDPDAHVVHLGAPAGGCRIANNWPKYMHGLAHNRAILIYRHMRWWHRPTALGRLFALGLSYCRLDRSLEPLGAAFMGARAGREAAARPPLTLELTVSECTSS